MLYKKIIIALPGYSTAYLLVWQSTPAENE